MNTSDRFTTFRDLDARGLRREHPHDHAHAHDHAAEDDHNELHNQLHEHGHHHGSADHVHDWHSRDYVQDWIDKDTARGDERRALLRHMLAAAPFETTQPLRILDVGGGYGAVSEETLRAFPKATIVLQDYSEPMLDKAKAQLSSHEGSVRFVHCDLLDAGWMTAVGGPFDLVVSAIALHNLRDREKIFRSYRDIRSLTLPGGCFLNYDIFGDDAGLEAHVRAHRDARFNAVDVIWKNDRKAIVRAC